MVEITVVLCFSLTGFPSYSSDAGGMGSPAAVVTAAAAGQLATPDARQSVYTSLCILVSANG